MFVIFEIAVTVLVIAGMVWFLGYKKKKNKSVIVALSMCAVIAALISANIVKAIPLPCDNVTITATGEKNEEAKADEVWIGGLCVGDEMIELSNPIEGKWFWKGNLYMWRNESDPRQPDGTTRTITIEIPIGKDRSVEFGSSKWNGIVDVTYDGETKSYDLFKGEVNERGYISAFIPDTNHVYLYAIKLLRLGLFAVIIAALLAFPVFCALKYEYGVLRGVFLKHWDKLVYIAIAYVWVAIMQQNTEATSMWFDEIWLVGTGYNTSNEIFTLNALLQRMWLQIMPYGSKHLLLLPQIFIGLTIYFVGLVGNCINGKRLGIIASVLTACSSVIIDQCGFEFSYYAVLVLLSTIYLYLLIKKQLTTLDPNASIYKKIFLISLFSLTAAMLMNTAEFSLVVSCLILAVDFVLLLMKRINKICWFEFILPFLYGIYWLTTFFTTGKLNAFGWIKTPTPNKIPDAILYLCDNNYFFAVMMLFGIFITLSSIFHKIFRNEFDWNKDVINISIVTIPWIYMALNYFFSTVLFPNNPIWLHRYFLCVIIMSILTTAFGIDYLIGYLSSIDKKRIVSVSATMTFVSLMLTNCFFKINYTMDHNYKGGYIEIADEIYNNNDMHCDSTIVLVDGVQEVAEGFQYFLTHKDKRDPLNVVSIYHLPENLLDYNTIYLTSVHHGLRRSPALKDLIGEYYNEVSNTLSGKLIKYVRK